MKKKPILSMILVASLSLTLTACSPTHFIYQDYIAHPVLQTVNGPSKWGELDPSFSACANGKEQSPINIEATKTQTGSSSDAVSFRYQPTEFAYINNAHTIQANVTKGDNLITVDGKEYKLAQFHFHLPSEHEVDGEPFDMELHLVHKSEDNKLAVLGVLLKEGQENAPLAELFSKLPAVPNKQPIPLEKSIDLNQLLPKNNSSFRYNGSLTTPPCSEGVKWIVLETPMELSKEQIAAFRSIYSQINRPIQPIHERTIIKSTLGQ